MPEDGLFTEEDTCGDDCNFDGIDTDIEDFLSDSKLEVGALSEDVPSMHVLGRDSNRVIIFSRSFSHFVDPEFPHKLVAASLIVLFAIVKTCE